MNEGQKAKPHSNHLSLMLEEMSRLGTTASNERHSREDVLLPLDPLSSAL